LAIVAEPTLLDLVDRHKGAVRWKVHAQGVACHSSTPRLGANAIYRMARVVRALEEYAQALTDDLSDPVLGPATLSVGRIEGGQSVNVVPDWCTIEVDRRLIPGEDHETVMARIRRTLDERLGAPDWLSFSAPWINFPPLAPSREGAERWLAPLRDAVARSTGRTPRVTGVPYGTDAGPLGATGLPCFVFGPGDIAQAHTKDEWVELDQVGAASEAYFQMVCALGRAAPAS
jgi:acetylornithine deacetylase